MADPYYVPPAPAITSMRRLTFVGQPAVLISGTEDISGLPSGVSIWISILDMTRDDNPIGDHGQVNSDGSWQLLVPDYAGDLVFAIATASNGATAQTAPFTLP
tara:strand:+ start:2819 stop:3127 length:309 start_codon:yes stop_codon:yes gene_type:complete